MPDEHSVAINGKEVAKINEGQLEALLAYLRANTDATAEYGDVGGTPAPVATPEQAAMPEGDA